MTPQGEQMLEQLLTQRYSCRGFRPDPVPRSTIERVLELARLTPSWCNTQPWHTYVTSGASTESFRDELRAVAADEAQPDLPFPGSYSGVRLDRRREVARQLYEAVGVARGDRTGSAVQAAQNFELFGAPHAAIITTAAELGVYGAVDCGLYVQSFLLAAQSLGLGAVPQAALAAHAKVVREFFEIPDDQLVLCGISFGWPADDHPANSFRSTRAELADTTTWRDS